MKNIPRKLLYACAGLSAVAIVALALRPTPLGVETYTVRRKDVAVTVEAEGKTRIEPESRFVVSAPVTGRIARIDLEAGDTVNQGAVVARINPLPIDSEVNRAKARLRELQAEREGVATLRPKQEALAQARSRIGAAQATQREAIARVQQARAALEQARRDRQRLEGLASAGAIPRQEFEQARLSETTRAKELEVAQREVDRAVSGVTTAQQALSLLQAEQRDPDYKLDVYDAQIAQVEAELAKLADDARQTTISAPVSGYVLRVLERSERFVSEGTPLVELGNTKNLELIIDVLSTDAVKIKPGMKVTIDHWGGGEMLEGTVRTVEPSAFTKVSALGVEEQRVNAIADLTNPPAPLGDGYRVEANIAIWEGEDVLAVPLSALFRCTPSGNSPQSEDTWCAFVVVDGKAQQRQVEVTRRSNFEAVVQGGLTEGEQAIVHPSEQIEDGSAVEIR